MNKWKNETVKQLSKNIQSGFACNKNFEVPDGYVHLRTHNIDTSGKINKDLFIKIDPSKVDKKKNKIFEGDVLFNNTNSTELVGKTALVKNEEYFSYSNHITKITFDEKKVLPAFAVYYFNKLWLDGYFARISKKWIGQSGVNSSKLQEIQIPHPLPVEQREIVLKLDDIFKKLDKANNLFKENMSKIQALQDSVLNTIFDGVAEKYEKVPLLQHVQFIGGSQPPKSSFSDKPEEGYVRLIQIRDYKSDNHLVYIKENSTKKFCDVDDIMIGRYGPPVFQILRGLKGAYNVALMKAIPDENLILKDYLYYFLMNGKIQNYIISISQRSAGQSGVNKKALEAYEIAIPPLDVQRKIVKKIKSTVPKIEDTISLIEGNMNYCKDLKISLLNKAFKGELV